MTRRFYTDEELLALLQTLANELGHSPLQKDLRSIPGAPNPTTISRRFGSWKAALRYAGLSPERGYTREEVLRLVRMTAQVLGRMPKQRELPVSYGVVRKWFGGMEGLRRALNADVDRVTEDETYE